MESSEAAAPQYLQEQGSNRGVVKPGMSPYHYYRMSWEDLPLTYLPCPHLHFRHENVRRDRLKREDHIALLATPKGYRWLGAADLQQPKPYAIARVEQKRKKRVRGSPIAGTEQRYIHEFLADIWTLMTPEMIESLKKLLVDDFGMPLVEAEKFIEQQSGMVQTSKKKSCIVNLDIRSHWLKQFRRLIATKITDYIVSMMSARRTKRCRLISEEVLRHICDLTGEYCTLSTPENRVQRLQVFIADRIAVWLSQAVAESDKELCVEMKDRGEGLDGSLPKKEKPPKPKQPKPKPLLPPKKETEKPTTGVPPGGTGSQPSSKPDSKPASQPVSKPGSQPTSKPVSKPTSKPVSKPTSKPGSKPTSKPESKPESKPGSMPESKPASEPASKPQSEPPSEPTSQQGSKPGSQPGSRPDKAPGSPEGEPISESVGGESGTEGAGDAEEELVDMIGDEGEGEDEEEFPSPTDAMGDVIDETEGEKTDRQSALSDLLESEILDKLEDVTVSEEDAIGAGADKVGAWADQLLSEAEEAIPPVPPPVSKDVTFHIRKKDSGCYYDIKTIDPKVTCEKTALARSKRVSVAAQAICRRPEIEEAVKPNKGDLKKWAEWASTTVTFAEKWAAWIDKTCKEAESKATSPQRGEREWKVNLNKWKKEAETSALEWRRNKKYLKETEKMWQEKLEKMKTKNN